MDSIEATVYQKGTSYFLAIGENVTEVPYLTGPSNSLVNEIRFHKARLMYRGETLSIFHPQDLERRLNDSDTRVLQSQANLSILNPPAEIFSTQSLQEVA